MREIKFRGKSEFSGEWVYGFGVQKLEDGFTILLIKDEYEEVFRETVGQFTGLYDKNGNEIYESDIVKYQPISYTDCSRSEIESIGEVSIGEIYYVEGIVPGIKYANGAEHVFMPYHLLGCEQDFEVIGSKYDHPHLSEGVK